MASPSLLVVVVFLSLLSRFSFAFDPSPLQDFCVTDLKSKVHVNGFACKDPAKVTVNDFIFSGLHIPRNTTTRFGSNITLVNAKALPGLNTLGISIARIDFATRGLNPPHTHPRATEVLTVLEGTLYAGFLTPPPESRLFAKVVHKGDVIVFPIGTIQFQLNVGDTPAVALSSLSSQNPGVISIASTIFGSKPKVYDELLAKAFQTDKDVIDHLQSLKWTNK